MTTRDLETFFIALHRRHPALNGMKIVHHGEDAPATGNSIVVKAELGDVELRGPRVALPGGGTADPSVYKFTVTSTFRGTTASAQQNDAIEMAMVESVYNARPGAADGRAFKWLSIDDDGEGSKESGQNVRRRTRTFTGHAK